MLSFSEHVRIKLVGRGGSVSSEKPDAFLKDLHTASTEHPFDNHSRILHKTVIHASKDGNEVHIHDIQSLDPDHGNGTKALKHLTGLADKHGIKLNLHAKRYGSHISNFGTEELQKWYRKHGFQHEDEPEYRHEGSDMIYYPK